LAKQQINLEINNSKAITEWTWIYQQAYVSLKGKKDRKKSTLSVLGTDNKTRNQYYLTFSIM
jgi:hypothetical protein